MFEYETVARLRADASAAWAAHRMAEDRVSALRAALRTIRDEYGHVCPEFETCSHVACRDSYSAWHVANEALGGSVVRQRDEELRAAVADLLVAWYAGGSHEDVALRVAPIVGRLREASGDEPR